MTPMRVIALGVIVATKVCGIPLQESVCLCVHCISPYFSGFDCSFAHEVKECQYSERVVLSHKLNCSSFNGPATRCRRGAIRSGDL